MVRLPTVCCAQHASQAIESKSVQLYGLCASRNGVSLFHINIDKSASSTCVMRLFDRSKSIVSGGKCKSAAPGMAESLLSDKSMKKLVEFLLLTVVGFGARKKSNAAASIVVILLLRRQSSARRSVVIIQKNEFKKFSVILASGIRLPVVVLFRVVGIRFQNASAVSSCMTLLERSSIPPPIDATDLTILRGAATDCILLFVMLNVVIFVNTLSAASGIAFN